MVILGFDGRAFCRRFDSILKTFRLGRNMLPLSEYLARSVALLSGHQLLRPKYLAFEATSYCQFSCEVCGATSPHCSRPRGMMEWGLFEHLVGQAVLMRPERVYLHAFGEPLMHPRIVDMVDLLSSRGLDTELVTNGELLTPQLARRLRDAGLCELGISHPNVSPENYLVCRGKPVSFDSDARIAAAVAEWEGSGKRVSIRCLTVRKLLSKGAPETAEFLDRWLTTPGVDLVVFHGYIPWPKHVCPDLMDSLLARTRRCPVGLRSLTVLWDGVATPCSCDVDAELAVGRAPDDSLVSLYNGGSMRALRRQWLSRHRLPPICRRCLAPRCPAASAWIGRREWQERQSLGAEQRVWIGDTAKLTLAGNGKMEGKRK